jgi:hypothetical protein
MEGDTLGTMWLGVNQISLIIIDLGIRVPLIDPDIMNQIQINSILIMEGAIHLPDIIRVNARGIHQGVEAGTSTILRITAEVVVIIDIRDLIILIITTTQSRIEIPDIKPTLK